MTRKDSSVDISVVVPIFNEGMAIAPFLAEIRPSLERALALLGHDMVAEIIFVDDGSSDNSYAQLQALATKASDIRIIKLSRNFGKEAALTAGLRYATGRAVIPIDVDLQDPPDLIVDMVECWRDGAQIVNARRTSRDGDLIIKRCSAQAFYSLYNRLSDYPIPYDVGDFRLLDRKVVNAVMAMQESVRFNKGLFSWVGFHSKTIAYDRPKRIDGSPSRWPTLGLVRLALDGITTSTTWPLRVWSSVGFLVAACALLYGVVMVILKWVGIITIPGYTSLMVAILFFSGLNLICFGIMGEYVGRVAHEVRRRPLYIVDETVGF